MAQSKQNNLAYWKQLKFYVDEQNLDWTFTSLGGDALAVVGIGSPEHRMHLSLNDMYSKNARTVIAAGFWIPDSKEAFSYLKDKRGLIEAEMGKALVWDSKPGRKSSWIWVKTNFDLSHQKNWPASIEWFAVNATKLRDVCWKGLE